MSRSQHRKRRTFLKGLALTGISPRLVLSALPANPDIVIIGAGAAGLEAAKTLRSRGISHVVLEANNRIGGRCHTDTRIFGVPFDMCAHWMQHRRENPLISYAKDSGFDIYKHDENYRLFVGNREARGKEYRSYENQYADYYERLESSAESSATGKNDSARYALGPSFFASPWGYTVASIDGPWDMAKNSDDWSPKDGSNAIDGDDWFCREGYGAVLAHYGQEVPVALSTAATEIDWRGKGVKVKTSAGSLYTKAVILTVSTGVLGANRIKFTPALPDKKYAAFDAIRMGTFNYIALQFSEDIFGYGPDTYLFQQQTDENGIGYLSNASQSNLTYGFVGGEQAKALEKEHMQVAIDWGLEGIRNMLGNDAGKKLVKGFSTAWGQNPLFGGAYASAQPGQSAMRKVLRAPIANKIYFSGEACDKTMWATVGGALRSGQKSARMAARYVKRIS
jgi:monoamine oxidase